MKKLFLLGALIAILWGCSTAEQKPDKRDKYVGEYKLYQDKNWWGEHQGVNWDYLTNSYRMEYFNHTKSDSSLTLVVTKNPNDTVSLMFDLVSPFNFDHQKDVIAENEARKKRNEASICGEDEEMLIVPEPTYSNNRVLEYSYSGDIKGHKIFINGLNKGDDYRGSGYREEITFDSVYWMNDTIHFKRRSSAEFFYNYKKTGWQILIERCFGVKIQN